MDENLLGMVLPRRKSAAQASRAFAGQLDSSDGDSQPGGSDGEVNPKKKVSNGAASRGSKPHTYGRRGGRPSKPAVLTSASAISVPGKLALPEKESTPRAPKPKSKPVKRKRSPSVSIHSMNETVSSAPAGAEEPSVQAKATDKAISFVHTTSPERVHKRTKTSQDRPSSPPQTVVFTSLSHSVGPDSSDSEVEILSFTPAVLTPSEPAGIPSTQVALSHGSRKREEPAWTSQNLGCYVWVLIEPTIGRVVDPNKNQSQDEYWMWWPGKITSPSQTEIPLRVKLFGQKNVVIHEPSEANIVSKLDGLGRWRYQSPFFVSSPVQQTPSPSGKKLRNKNEDLQQHPCEDLEGRWKTAVIEMKQAEEAEQDSDYLPDVGEISSWATSGLSLSQDNGAAKVDGRGKKKGKRKRKEFFDEEVFLWEPPQPDDTLQIPGELVLGRENPGRGPSAIHNLVHWPAKILAYKAPKHPKQQPKYLIKWLDGSEGEITRSCFYTVDEEGFAICKLGSFESSVVEVENDDESEDLETSKARWDFSRRSPSPETIDPPPSIEQFRQLSIRVRFAYTKSVLSAILNKDYEPVLELHQLFMAGGQKRGQLLEYSSRRGRIDPKEVTELTNYLKEWCLRSPIANTSLVYDDVREADVRDDVEDTVEQDKVGVERNLSESPKHDVKSCVNLVGYDSRSPSPSITEAVPSSPGEMPPSSSFPVEREQSPVSESMSSLGANSSPPRAVVISSSVAECALATDIVPVDIPDVLGVNDSDRTIFRKERFPRQRGCEEYEALSDLDKLNYCTAILLPESIRQLLLWQNGIRSSIELLTPEEERELYEKGETLLNETEWVFNVKRMRQKAEDLLKKNGTGRRRTQPVDYRE